MRTTLDIDPRVLAVARSRVDQGQYKSLGEAVSALALAGLDSAAQVPVTAGGLVLLPAADGHVVTDEMVAAALLDD